MKKDFKISIILTFLASVIIITITIFNSGTTIYNKMPEMTSAVINELEPYTTEYIYDQSIPSTSDKVVMRKGVPGLSYTYDGLTYTHVSDMRSEIVKVGTGRPGNFTGTLTGYGPDCPGCSIVGNVACRTREGKNHSLINDGVYYLDSNYGEVRILAADNSAFPCGTIVKINNGVLDEFYGIVLDSGYTMRKAWSEGKVWMDMAFSSQSATGLSQATSKNTKFSVQRWGW